MPDRFCISQLCRSLPVKRSLPHRYPTRPSSIPRRLSSTYKTSSGQILDINGEVPTCSCDCSPMPSDLDIDYKRPLTNTVANHNQHLIISTGKSDWSSKIETEKGFGRMAEAMRSLIGPQGEFYNVRLDKLIISKFFRRESVPDTSNQSV